MLPQEENFPATYSFLSAVALPKLLLENRLAASRPMVGLRDICQNSCEL
jgi:hypothetical protein